MNLPVYEDNVRPDNQPSLPKAYNPHRVVALTGGPKRPASLVHYQYSMERGVNHEA